MADVASPSATFSEAPAQRGGFTDSAIGAMKKYWYVTLAVAIIVGYIIYNFIRNSQAQVGNASTTVDPNAINANGLTPTDNSANLPDAASILDLLSQSYQAMADNIAAGAMVATQANPAVMPGSSTPATAKATPAQKQAQTSGSYSPPAAFVAPKASAPAPAALVPASAAKTSGTIAQRNTSGARVSTAPVRKPVLGNIFAPTSVSGRRSSGNLMIGGPPPSGVAVPFGTHISLHDPLASDGSMYAKDRSILQAV